MNSLLRPLRSSLGAKYVMALTGLGLIGFVIAHMSGNLLVYLGRDALNSYAAGLSSRPGLLWAARLGLLALFVLHVVLGLRLTWENQLARPVGYVFERTVRANWASRHMLLTGLVLLAFLVYHLAHFTLGVVKPAEVDVPRADGDTEKQHKSYLDLAEARNAKTKQFVPRLDLDLRKVDKRSVEVRHDVYAMVVSGFRNPWVTISYLVAMAFLGLHLWHGGSSWFQSLGLNHPRYHWLTHNFGPVVALVVVAGNCSIPLAVLLGIVA